MPADPKRRATYRDVLEAPENMIAEVIDGDLQLQPRPAMAHAAAVSTLSGELAGPFGRGRGGPGGWILLFEPELHLGPDILVPDYAGWRRERMPRIPVDKPYVTMPPDWVCEALSPRREKIDRVDKLPIYAREGIGHVWFVDPLKRTLEAMRLEAGKWLIVGVWRDDAKVRAEPFDAIELELGALWADVEPIEPL
jgi:Uma2 family endonuclease